MINKSQIESELRYREAKTSFIKWATVLEIATVCVIVLGILALVVAYVEVNL